MTSFTVCQQRVLQYSWSPPQHYRQQAMSPSHFYLIINSLNDVNFKCCRSKSLLLTDTIEISAWRWTCGTDFQACLYECSFTNLRFNFLQSFSYMDIVLGISLPFTVHAMAWYEFRQWRNTFYIFELPDSRHWSSISLAVFFYLP